MEWIWLSIVYGIALAMDCLALSITDGLVYDDLNKKRWQPFFIAGVFAFGQMIFPLLGFLLGETVATIIDSFDHWIAFALLVFIGGKMIFDGIKDIVKPEEKKPGHFSTKEVLLQGVADSIDALAVGITLPVNIGLAKAGEAYVGLTDYRNYIAIIIIGIMTFLISLVGLFAGKGISKLLKGKYEISEIIGGTVLVALAIIIVLESYGYLTI
jgi:putative Mn2+ efflux pump MntP